MLKHYKCAYTFLKVLGDQRKYGILVDHPNANPFGNFSELLPQFVLNLNLFSDCIDSHSHMLTDNAEHGVLPLPLESNQWNENADLPRLCSSGCF